MTKQKLQLVAKDQIGYIVYITNTYGKVSTDNYGNLPFVFTNHGLWNHDIMQIGERCQYDIYTDGRRYYTDKVYATSRLAAIAKQRAKRLEKATKVEEPVVEEEPVAEEPVVAPVEVIEKPVEVVETCACEECECEEPIEEEGDFFSEDEEEEYSEYDIDEYYYEDTTFRHNQHKLR